MRAAVPLVSEETSGEVASEPQRRTSDGGASMTNSLVPAPANPLVDIPPPPPVATPPPPPIKEEPPTAASESLPKAPNPFAPVGAPAEAEAARKAASAPPAAPETTGADSGSLMVPFSPEPSELLETSVDAIASEPPAPNPPVSVAPVPPAETAGAASTAAPPESGRVRVVAMFEFAGVEEGDLPFKEGERFEADATELAEQSDGGWVTGWHNGKEGVFPSNYVTKA